MHILHLNDSIESKGGVEVYLAQLMEYYPMEGQACKWMGVKRKESRLEVHLFPDKTAHWTGEFPTWENWFSAFLDQHQIDLIHLHSISDIAIIKTCLNLRPVIRSMHEPRLFCPGQGKFWRYSERICTQPFGMHCLLHTYTEGCSNRHPASLLKAMKRTHFEINQAAPQYKSIIAMSDFMKAEAVKAGIAASTIEVNPYFTTEVEEDPGFSSEEKRVLFIGRFISHKGVHYAVQAMVPILKANPNTYLDLVGDGVHFPALIQILEEAKEAGVSDRIKLHGWKGRAEIQQLLAACSIVVFPSIYPEAFGIVGIEAMMHGKAVVAFDVGGVSSWLEHEVSGYLAPAKDVSSLQFYLEQLLNDETIRTKFGKQGREIAKRKFVPSVHIQTLMNIYEQALGHQSLIAK